MDGKLFDIYPTLTQFRLGQCVEILLEMPSSIRASDAISISVYHHHEIVFQSQSAVKEIEQQNGLVNIGTFPNGGYHITANLVSESYEWQASSAFDIADGWWAAPRYSFLCNFQPTSSHEDIQSFFRKFHLNVSQFYDWMERHDALVPRTQNFVDPMGRMLSTDGILSRMHALKDIQTACFAYAAVYASLADYAQLHPEEGIYDNRGSQLSLISIFYLMDISEGSSWRNHIIAEFKRVLDFGFDGLHLDQYGFPKLAARSDGTSFWMDEAYRSFINDCRTMLGNTAGLLFNAVSSYPIHSVSTADQNAVYVEIWPPMVRYRHLLDVITRIRLMTNGKKQVILAAYLKAFRSEPYTSADALVKSALLVTAVIYASGGYHLVLGESSGMLTEPYYPDYVSMPLELERPLRFMYDIVTADAELLSGFNVSDVTFSFTAGINDDIRIDGVPISIEPEKGTVWVRVTKSSSGLLIHFINLLWLENDTWNYVHKELFQPAPSLDVSIEWNGPLSGVWTQSADAPGWHRAETVWVPHVRGEAVQVTVPSFDVWSMLFIPFHT